MREQMSEFNPTQALAALHEARAGAAVRTTQGDWRYELGYGALAGLLVGGQGLGAPLSIFASSLAAIGLSALATARARRSGMWVSGIAPRRARWVALGLGVITLFAAFGVVWARRAGMAWVAWPAGIGMAAIAIMASRLWRWVYRSDTADATDMQEDFLSRRPQLLLVALGLAVFAAAGGMALYAQHGADEGWIGYAIGVGIGVLAAAGLYTLKRAGVLGARR